MTGRRLAELFTEAAEDVPAPAFARTAWVHARRTRRRRRIAGASVAAGLAAVVGVAGTLSAGGGGSVTLLPTGAPDRSSAAPGGTPTTPSTLAPNVDGVPDRLPAGATPRLAAQVPDLDAAKVAGLSQVKGHTAVALYERSPGENATAPADVYAWLDDGSWARLDQVRLRFAQDAGGNLQNPLDATSLSADGRFAAFAQPDEVVVVAVETGEVSRIPLPGFNEHAIWSGPGVLFVGQDTVAYRLDVASRKYVQTGVSGWDLAAGNDPAATVVELPQTDRSSGKLVQREWSADGVTLRRTVAVSSSNVGAYGVDEWYGRGWRRGDLVVRAGFGHSSDVQGSETVVAIDVRTGAIVRLLALGMERWKGCCEPIGWLDDATVLLRINPDGVVTWNVRTGALRQVAPWFEGTIAPRSS